MPKWQAPRPAPPRPVPEILLVPALVLLAVMDAAYGAIRVIEVGLWPAMLGWALVTLLVFPTQIAVVFGRQRDREVALRREVEDQDLPAVVPTRHFVAPVTGDWAGAMARITGVVDDGVARRVVGVADHAGHLEGLSLAAAALTVATGAYPPGLQWPSTHEESLEHALAAGLAVATFTIEESSRERG